MDTISNGLLEQTPAPSQLWDTRNIDPPEHASPTSPVTPTWSGNVELLRRYAWEIGARRPADGFTPALSHVGLALVSPGQGFAHWRILPEWVQQSARQEGP